MITKSSLALCAAAACLLFPGCESQDAAGPEEPLPALQKWSFSGHEITYKSGIAVPSWNSEGKAVPGITVWLTDQPLDCSDAAEVLPNASGGWVGIKYPEISLGKGLVRVFVGYWPGGPGPGGNIDNQGTAALTQADTATGKTVSGYLDFHSGEADPEDGFGKADVKGSFTVPYCPVP